MHLQLYRHPPRGRATATERERYTARATPHQSECWCERALTTPVKTTTTCSRAHQQQLASEQSSERACEGGTEGGSKGAEWDQDGAMYWICVCSMISVSRAIRCFWKLQAAGYLAGLVCLATHRPRPILAASLNVSRPSWDCERWDCVPAILGRSLVHMPRPPVPTLASESQSI